MYHPLLALAILLGICGIAAATTWTSVASDSSGQYLTASSTYVYTSDNFGGNWTAQPLFASWMGVASDATGKKLVGVTSCTTSGVCAGVYDSTDRGATWTQPEKPLTKDNYYATSSDESGQHLIAVGGEGVFYSANGGTAWARFNLLQGFNGDVGSVSGSGSSVVLVYMNLLTVTTNGGGSWTPLPAPEAHWRGVSQDHTGKIIAGAFDFAYGSGGNFLSGWYVSTDAGATVTAIKSVNDGEKFYSVSANADGTYVFCGGSAGIYVYNVAKKTVTMSSAPTGGYYSIASSKTGKYVLAASSYLYVSSDYGVTFSKVK